MTRISGVIFDCDGVLFESRAANLAYYNVVLKHFGEPPVSAADRATAHLCHTAASPEVFVALLGPQRAAAALDYAATLDYRDFIPFMQPEPELTEVLTILAEKVPLAVATNRGASISGILAHFGLAHLFRTVVTSRDVERPKPYPDMLQLAARRLRLKEEELLFVGDSELDREAARQAGVRFAAYKGGVEAELTVYSHRELAALVRGG
jgi:HAD superfamily hydrolase (TIGR01509 family)